MTREKLPNRRMTHTISFRHDGTTFHGSVGFYPDGRVAEVFLDGGKVGSSIHSIARDGAVAMSIGLQYGAPLDVIRDALTRLAEGEPAGPFARLLDEITKIEPLPQDATLTIVE